MVGFWYQPASDVIDRIMEHDPSLLLERDAIEEWAKTTGLVQDDSQLFHALIAVDDDGLIREATIVDKLGPALLRHGRFDGDLLIFRKDYFDRDDSIAYELKLGTDGFYAGMYSGEVVGRGFARCYVFDPHPKFFSVHTSV